MGNDGGSIPGRKDLVREKPKEIKIDNEILAKARAKFCAMTKQRLNPPLAVCRLGLIYNYEEVLNLMMEKKIPHEFAHLRSLKDLKMLKNIEMNSEKNSDFPLICPISKIEYNGLNKFKAFWSCGCMCSEKAIEELSKGKKEKLCIVCLTPYTLEDEISLNLTAEEQNIKKHELLRQIEKKNIQKAEHKKEKKKEKKGKGDDEEEKTHKKSKLNNGEAKKINPNEPFKNILDNICEKNETESGNQSEVFKSLFHKEYQVEDNLFHRNVRHGIR